MGEGHPCRIHCDWRTDEKEGVIKQCAGGCPLRSIGRQARQRVEQHGGDSSNNNSPIWRPRRPCTAPLAEPINQETNRSANNRRTSKQFAEPLRNVAAKVRHEDDCKPRTERRIKQAERDGADEISNAGEWHNRLRKMRADPKRGGNNSKDPRNGDPKEAHRSRALLREERLPSAVYPLVELLLPPTRLPHEGECTRPAGMTAEASHFIR